MDGTARDGRVRRPIGYTIVAVLLALGSLATVPQVIWTPFAAFGGSVTLLVFLQAAMLAIGLVAAWALWTVRPWAPEAFLSWAALMLATALYSMVSILPVVLAHVAASSDVRLPPQLGEMVLGIVLTQALVLALVYWYLHAKRPRRDPAHRLGDPRTHGA